MITTEFIFLAATIVFLLMLIGIILTMHEFEKLVDEPALDKGERSGNQTARPQENPAGRG